MSDQIQDLEKETQGLIQKLTDFHALAFKSSPSTSKHRTRAAVKDTPTPAIAHDEKKRQIRRRLDDFKVTFHSIYTRLEVAWGLTGEPDPLGSENFATKTVIEEEGHGKEEEKQQEDENSQEEKKPANDEKLTEKEKPRLGLEEKPNEEKPNEEKITVELGSMRSASRPTCLDSEVDSRRRFRSSEKAVKDQTLKPSAESKNMPPKTQSQGNGDASDLRYKCQLADLGQNLVSTIMKARTELGSNRVDERGYLILNTDVSLTSSDVVELLRSAKQDKKDYVRGFTQIGHEDGYLEAHVDAAASLDFSQFSESDWSTSTISDPEADFQNWVDEPTDKVRYLIGPPWKQDHFVNELLSPGPTLKRRQPIPGVNRPYWYLSLDAKTPATVHIEDARTGSVNMLMCGATKQWLIIHATSKLDFERWIRKEFPHSRKCSQFVRHHNIILGPAWLKQRDIRFEVVLQKPGELFCTMPGDVYHAVLNSGPNFAIAENYEFPDAPELPLAYLWCEKGKGANRCGEHVITSKDFRFQAREADSKPVSRVQDQQNTDLIVVSDNDDPGHTAHTLSMLHLPKPVADTTQDIQNLIDACLNQTEAPLWMGCQNKDQLKIKLQRFLPDGWLCDDLLLRLLRLIALPLDYHVVESLGVDIAAAEAADVHRVLERAGNDVKGLIMPFHVKLNWQTRKTHSEERNHWAIGIFDRNALTFTAFDIEEPVAQSWAGAIGAALTDLSGIQTTVHTITQPLPPNPDGASCGLCCCLALEGFLRVLSPSQGKSSLRSYYLRKLLCAFRFAIQHDIVGDASMSAARSTAERVVRNTPENARAEDGTLTVELDFQREEIDEHHVKTIKQALADNSLAEERRWRIVQMIMQCSIPDFEQLAFAHKVLPPPFKHESTPAKNILLLMEKLQRTSSEYFLPALQHRMRLMELHVAFENQVQHEETQMRHNLAVRKRLSAAGEKLERLPNSGMSAKNRALDAIIAVEGDDKTAQKRLRKQMETYTSCGANLKFLVLKLGLGLLLALPSCTVHQCDFKLRPSFSSQDEKHIEPSDYHFMSEEEAKFFVRWLPILKDRELQGWDQTWTDVLLPRSQFWQTHDRVSQNLSDCFPKRGILPKRKKAASSGQTIKRRKLIEQV